MKEILRNIAKTKKRVTLHMQGDTELPRNGHATPPWAYPHPHLLHVFSYFPRMTRVGVIVQNIYYCLAKYLVHSNRSKQTKICWILS